MPLAKCPKCSMEAPERARFCRQCGARLDAPSAPAAPAVSGAARAGRPILQDGANPSARQERIRSMERRLAGLQTRSGESPAGSGPYTNTAATDHYALDKGYSPEAAAGPAQKHTTQVDSQEDRNGDAGKAGISRGAMTFVPILEPGRGYLLKEPRSRLCFEVFGHNLKPGAAGLLISRRSPKRISQDHAVEGARMLWLTDRESSSVEVVPPSLERISYDFRQELKRSGRVLLLIDGIEYLITVNGFNPVLQFVRMLVDECAETDSIMLVSVSPDALGLRESNMLERELDVLELDG